MLKVILSIGTIQAVAIIIQFVRSKVVAVTLGPAGVGIVSTIDQTVQFVAFATALSIPLASVKFLSKAHSEGHEAFKRTYAGFFHLLALLSVAGTIIAVGLVFLRPQMFGAEIEKYQIYLLIALLSVPPLILSGFFTNVFAAAQNYRVSSALAVINSSATTVAVIAGIFAAGIFGLFVGGSLASIAVTVGITIYLWKKLDLPFFADSTESLKELRQSPNIVFFTAMLYFGSISYSLSALVARYAVLINFGEAETGLLQGALLLSFAVGMVLSPANGLYLTPIMNRNIEKSEKIRYAIKFQRNLILVFSLVALPLVMFPQLVLTIMFSTKFIPVGHLVFIFIVSQFIKQLAGVHQALMIGTDDLKIYSVITAVGETGYILLLWLAVPIYGIKGVALGSIVSNVAIFFATLIRLKFKHNFVAPRNLTWLIGYALAVLVVTGWISSQINEWDIASSILKVGFFTLFAASLLLFLSKEERLSLYGLRPKILFGR